MAGANVAATLVELLQGLRSRGVSSRDAAEEPSHVADQVLTGCCSQTLRAGHVVPGAGATRRSPKHLALTLCGAALRLLSERGWWPLVANLGRPLFAAPSQHG